MTIWITPRDDEVWAYTKAAVAASAELEACVTVRCSEGGCKIAFAGLVPEFGPLFVATWLVDRLSDVTHNGRRLTERERRADPDRAGSEVREYGRQDIMEPHSTMAMLRLPAELTQEYPTLLARCRHGDVVLDSVTVLGWVERPPRRDPRSKVSKPYRDYVAPRTDTAGLPTGTARRSSRTVRYRAPARSLAELDEWLQQWRPADGATPDHPPHR